MINFSNNNELFFENFDLILNENIIRSMGYENDKLAMTIERTFILEDNSRNKFLTVKLLIRQPGSDDRINDICSVKEWRLWQEP